MENGYTASMEIEFLENDLRNGRIIQTLFGKERLTNFFIRVIKHFPFINPKDDKANSWQRVLVNLHYASYSQSYYLMVFVIFATAR